MKIVALQGKGNIGKTTTLKLLILKILEKFPNSKIIYQYKDGIKDNQQLINKIKAQIDKEKRDRLSGVCRVLNVIIVLEINNKKIGICTYGDTKKLLVDAVKIFIENKCELCFSACLTTGETVDYLKSLDSAITIRKKRIIEINDKFEEINSEQAQEILNILIDYINS
ncbi:MAG: hypothetical protein PHI78_01030 [Clostridia bacterium]|nr:hypothetical protein [Clostridia bacterium]